MQHNPSGLFSGSGLKIIALLAMTLDHIAACGLVDGNLHIIFRSIGRIAFPLYAFLLSEGCRHTRYLPGYSSGLFVFALLSEIPFNLALHGEWFHPEHQNIYFTLTLSALACMLWTTFEKNDALKIITALALVFFGEILNVDYGAYGVFLPFLFFLTSEYRSAGIITGIITSRTPYQYPAYLAIFLYDGRRGFLKGNAKWFFYLYYPVHLGILAVLKML